MVKLLFRLCLLLLLGFYAQSALATPPYLSDTPVPTDYQKFQWYYYASAFGINGSPNLQFPAVELDWGFAPEQQVFILGALGTNFQQGGTNSVGIGDLQTGYVWRFITETATRPQVGFVPALFVPTGDQDRNLGFGHFVLKVPLAVQKTWGDWTLSGGGGYIFNSLPNAINFPYGGGLIQRDFHNKFGFGTEIFSQGTDKLSKGFTLLDVGAYYNFTQNVSLLFSIGTSIAGQQTAQGYLGLTCII